MSSLAARACRSRAHLLCLGAFTCLILFSLLSSGSRAIRAVEKGDAGGRVRSWPAAPFAQTYRWVEQRTREHDLVGWVELPGTPDGYDRERIAADLRHVIKPTWLSHGREPISLVTFADDRDHDEVKAEIKGLGFRTVWMHPLSRVAVALEGPPERAPPRFARLVPSDHYGAGLKLLLLALAPVLLALRRKPNSLPEPQDPETSSLAARLLAGILSPFAVTSESLRAALLVLLGVPYALAVSCALADTVGGSAVGTAVIYAGLIGAWCSLATRVYEPVLGDPASLAFRRQASGTDRSARLFRWGGAALALFACAGLALRLGLHTDGMIDAVAMYNARARAIVLDPSFLGPFVPPEGAHALHPDYPPALTFAVAGAYGIAGSFSAVAPIFVQLCFWLGGGGLLLAWAHRRAGRGAVLAVLAMLAILPHWQERIADQCCDVPLGLTWVAAMTLWYRRRTVPIAAATGLLLGGVLLMKNEGLLLVAAWLISVLLTAPKTLLARPARAAALLASLGAAALILTAFGANVPPSDLLGRLSTNNISPDRTFTIAQRFWQTIVWPGAYGWTFAIVAMATVMVAIDRVLAGVRGDQLEPAPESLRALPVALTIATAGYFAVYAATSFDIEWLLKTSSDRLFAQIFPATVMLGITIAGYVMPDPETEVTPMPSDMRQRARAWEERDTIEHAQPHFRREPVEH